MKVVKVLWVDSCNSNINWTVAEDIEAKPMYIDSFGVVIKDTDEFLVIAQNYGNNPEQYSNITTIPKGCIKEVFTIHEDNMYEKEQNSIDMVEPKFKVGDWITNGIETVQITGYDIDYGYQVDYKGNLLHRDTDIIEKEYHFWSIEDAKPGDVLTFKNNICGIIICKYTTYYNTRSYCRLVSGNFINKEESGWDSTLLVPATKEQRDQLENAMTDAGWEFDFEKKELKEIEQKPIIDGILTATNYDKMFKNYNVHKFNVGNWYVNQGKTYHLLSIDSGYWTIEDTDGNKYSPCLPPHESESHLWGIQDAKPGDVLVTGNAPFLYSGHEDDGYGIVCFSYGGISSNRDEFIINTNPGNRWCDVEFVKPATKEQHELLFQKTHEAGYIFDFERKEFKEFNPDDLIEESYQQQADDLIDAVTEKSA